MKPNTAFRIGLKPASDIDPKPTYKTWKEPSTLLPVKGAVIIAIISLLLAFTVQAADRKMGWSAFKEIATPTIITSSIDETSATATASPRSL